jgi:hypothetical protein
VCKYDELGIDLVELANPLQVRGWSSIYIFQMSSHAALNHVWEPHSGVTGIRWMYQRTVVCAGAGWLAVVLPMKSIAGTYKKNHVHMPAMN